MENQNIQCHLFISGIVQGVGYRFWTYKQAKNLKLNGWVRNLPDGRVEAVFAGQKEVVQKMINLCHSGPKLAQVQDIIIKDEILENLNDFEIR